MSRRDDTEEIDGALRDRLEVVLDAFAPGWMESRDRAYPNATSLQDLGSFSVQLQGQYRGGWRRFSQNIGGGPIKLIAYLLNGQVGEPTSEDFRRAFEEARRFLGMDEGEQGVDQTAVLDAQRKARENRQRAREEAAAKHRAKRLRIQEFAAELFEDAVPIAGTAAESYLKNRLIQMPAGGWPDVLRFTEALHPYVKQWFPCLLARVDNAAGELVGVQRVYLTHEGDKAPVPPGEVKLGLGNTAGGAVRLGPPVAGRIGIAEGVETALSVMSMPGMDLPVWATLGTAMKSFEPPMAVRHVRIFADHDLPKRKRATLDFHPGPTFTPPAGLAAAHALQARLVEEGVECVVDRSAPRGGKDFNDVLKALAKARAAAAARERRSRLT